jgi:molecular chaperone DnaJ
VPRSLTPSQRTLLELLADEFRDTTAKRILNVGQFSKENNSDMGSQQKLQETQRNTDESHQGLLRRIWDKLTHHEQQQHQKDDDKKSGSA